MTYAIIGTGGIGGYYGARLVAAGMDVHFLLRSDYEAVKRNGLHVSSIKGNIDLPSPCAYNSTTVMPKADVVLICVKTTANASLPELVRPILKPASVIVMIQNGLGMEQDLHERMPDARIIGATAFICSSKVGPGRINHTGYGELTLAPFGDALASEIDAICSDMESAGVPCHKAESLSVMRWKKLVWNIPYNGMSVVEGCKTDELTLRPDLRPRVLGMMHEVIRAAAACDAMIPDDFADAMIASTENMEPYWPSMYLDFAAHRKLEVGSIYERPVAEAASHGFDMVMTRQLLEALKLRG